MEAAVEAWLGLEQETTIGELRCFHLESNFSSDMFFRQINTGICLLPSCQVTQYQVAICHI